jgi:hypothetical protein
MANPQARRSGRAAPVAALIVASAVAAVLVVGALAITEHAETTLAKADGPVQLSSNPVWVPLRDPESGAALTIDMLRERRAGARIVLVLRDLSADAQPGTAFAVHIGVSRTPEPSTADPGYAGRFSFYNEINSGALKATPSSRSYDVAGALQRLGTSGAGSDAIGVTIRPERQPSARARATIGAIELVTQ